MSRNLSRRAFGKLLGAFGLGAAAAACSRATEADPNSNTFEDFELTIEPGDFTRLREQPPGTIQTAPQPTHWTQPCNIVVGQAMDDLVLGDLVTVTPEGLVYGPQRGVQPGKWGVALENAEAGCTLRVTFDGPISLLSSMEALPK